MQFYFRFKYTSTVVCNSLTLFNITIYTYCRVLNVLS